MITSHRLGRIYVEHVTASALPRKPRSQPMPWLSLLTIAGALGLLAANGV